MLFLLVSSINNLIKMYLQLDTYNQKIYKVFFGNLVQLFQLDQLLIIIQVDY